MVPASDPVTVKLYANRRLHEPRSGRYVTPDELIALVRDGIDITSSILSHRPTEH